MLFKSLVKASFIGAALAQPVQHQHHQHQQDKRDVKVVTKTNVVVVTLAGQQTTLSAVSLSSPTSSVSVASDTTYINQAHPSSFENPTTYETEAATTDEPTSSTETETESTSASESSSEATSSETSSPSGGNGITYSPYSSDGGCKSSSQISSEIKQLSDYDIIRIYGVDCDQANAVLSSKTSSQKVFAGIYDCQNIQDGVDTLSSAVKSNGGWDHIHTVSIGNELVNSGEATVSQVKKYVETGKSALQSAGYTGSVVTTDTFIATINNPDLCDVGDYTAINAHAFFDGYVAADQAGDWVLLQIERVSTACKNKKSVYVTESGWPSKGESNGVAVPSKSNQKKAVASIVDKVGNDVILFTAFNDLWKADGSYSAEKYWGIHSS